MYPPIPHDLKTYNEDSLDFEKYGFCQHQWEISVPQKNCILWGVVLSYLRSADFTLPGKFEERLYRLTGEIFDSELAKTAILDFNPFFNIHKCFFNETLKKINLSFKKLLDKNRQPSVSKNVRQDTQLISTLLESNILILDINGKKLHLVTPSNDHYADTAAITLICRERKKQFPMNPTKRFTFALNEDLCWEFRMNAFHVFLESTDIRAIAEKEIESLTEKKEKKVNLLIALLKKNLIHEITELYDSSYTMAKLADAGFETDPRVLYEDGFSAFYYALKSNDNNLVYILHRYAANSCYEFQNTLRDPDPCIISNLSKLKDILNGDCANSNSFQTFGVRAQEACLKHEDLQKFNEFLTQITQGINDIRKRPENSLLEKASKQKEIILHILDKYSSFFTVEPLDSKFGMENYSKHKAYYDNLDFSVALLFFDNIFLLKSILKSPEEGLYSKMESSFLLAALANKYFTVDTKNNEKFKDLGFELFSTNLSIISFLERLNLREKVMNFCSILRKKIPIEEDVVKCIPKEEITEILSDFPELKDEFLISRLDHYLKTALETTSKDLKQKLVIQRTLQVIGESINIEKEAPSSIRYLLRKCLPIKDLEVLKKTRNTLSHLKSFQFPFKFKAEKNDCLFESIQSEIQNIRDAFEEIFDIQRFRLMEFLVDRGLKSVLNFSQDMGSALHIFVQPMKNTREAIKKRTLEFQGISDQKATSGNCVSIPGIDEFCHQLMGFASIVQKEKIEKEFPIDVKKRIDAVKKLRKDLEDGKSINLDIFDNLFINSKDLCRIKEDYKKYLEMRLSAKRKKSLLRKIENSPTPQEILDRIYEMKKVTDSQLKFLHETIHFSDESKSLLDSLIGILKCPVGDSLANLLNRVEHLYQISIEEQCDIRFLWERAKSSKAKQYLVYKIVQRYFRESPFQASLEMLLFDCIDILKNKEDLKYFWRKDSYLFNGIDLRNVLAHGDPLLESIGDLLDPKDLPSDLVQKMLQLFEDRECIESLCVFWHKAKSCGMIPETVPDCYKLKERIVRCNRWQDYSKLLEDSNYSDLIVPFLKRIPEAKGKKKRHLINSKVNSEPSEN